LVASPSTTRRFCAASSIDPFRATRVRSLHINST
jgi:hypothetical protein